MNLRTWVLFGVFVLSSASPCSSGKTRAEDLGHEVDLEVDGEHIDMAIDNDSDLHLAYNRGEAVYYLHQDNGVWQDEMLVPGSNGTYSSRWYPHIAVDSKGNAHFAWTGYGGIAYVVYYNGYIDGSWSGLQTVLTDQVSPCDSQYQGTGADTNRCDIAVGPDDAVFVVAQSDWAIDYNMKPSSTGFSGEVQIPGSYYCGSEPKNPVVYFSPVTGLVYAVWTKNSMYPQEGIQVNTWSGTWGAAYRPAGSGGYCCANNSDMFVDYLGHQHYVWIAWTSEDADYSDLVYLGQDADGDWNEAAALISSPSYFTCPADECPYPVIRGTPDGTIVIVFADGSHTRSDSRVRYFIKAPAGTWSGPREITSGSNYQNYPALAVGDHSTFFVAWSDGRGSIYMRSLMLFETLDAPVLVEASLNRHEVTLRWQGPEDPHGILDHYKVFRSSGGPRFTVIAETKDTAHVDELPVLDGVLYTYKVAAVDMYGRESPQSNALSVYSGGETDGGSAESREPEILYDEESSNLVDVTPDSGLDAGLENEQADVGQADEEPRAIDVEAGEHETNGSNGCGCGSGTRAGLILGILLLSAWAAITKSANNS